MTNRKELLAMFSAFVETIRESKEAPIGPMYAAVMGKISLHEFQGIMDTIKAVLLVKVTAELAIWTEESEQIYQRLKAGDRSILGGPK